MLNEIRIEIEKVIEGYCDGTYQGLSHGHLIEYFGEGSNKNPQTLADEIMVVIKRHLTKRAADGYAVSPEPLNVIADNTGSPRRGVFRRR